MLCAVKHDAVVEQERKQKEREDEAARQEAERIAKTPIDAAGQDTAIAAAADGAADAAVPEEPAGDHITSMEPALTGELSSSLLARPLPACMQPPLCALFSSPQH